MKSRFFSLAICILFFATTNAQQVVEDKKSGDEENIFTKVEVDANTNPKAWAEHVKKSTQLPDSILKEIPPGTYKVSVQFIVDVHGNIGQVKAKNDPGYGFAKKAEKIILSYKGTWQPASQCGRNVKAYKSQSITFIVPDISSQPSL